MARITEEMVRKRAEHNECEITTLEELSLHQQDIEKIEHLDRWCRDLKILYLQSNLIPKIENVGRLKKLEYLNLALNNVTKIENLERCESLQKLDLTVNFVSDLLSIMSLKNNIHLEELFLTGNPCTDYKGYRDFVVASLPQLKWLDGREITKSERILASQILAELTESIKKQQEEYELKQRREKEEEQRRKEEIGVEKTNGEDEERFMEETVPHTPESRTTLHKHLSEKRQEGKSETRNPHPPKRERRLERDGRILNVNEGRYEFTLEEDDERQCFVVDVSCPKFMDTSLIECDVQPSYMKVTIKGKILQLVLPEEVSPDNSTAQRSKTTGHLVVTMPKANPVVRPKVHNAKASEQKKSVTNGITETKKEEPNTNSYQYLEVSENVLKIIKDEKEPVAQRTRLPETLKTAEVCPSEDFVDDPDVPPLI